MKVSAIITAGGKGERAGFNKNKLLVEVQGSTLLEKTFNAFKSHGSIDEIVIAVNKNDLETVKSILGDAPVYIIGGSTRTQSVKNALAVVTGGIVLIHDGARPDVTHEIIDDCIKSVLKHGSGITGVVSRDTVALMENEIISGYTDRNNVFLVQTPQAFYTKDILKAYALAGDVAYNDDSEVYKTYIAPPHIVNGSCKNIKYTYAEDFNPSPDIRFGVGFDCHRLTENRNLILGGVHIPYDKGLLGHSDADVLTHAIMDAILSALSLRDIGYHFPPSDPKYKDANSMELLDKVLNLINQKGYKVKTVSAVVMAEKPKLLNYIPTITQSIANAVGVSTDAVGITATTLEGLGFVGREEGICVHANIILQSA